MSTSPTEIFAERLAVQARQHDATDPRLIACHFTAGWLAAVDALNAKGLAQDLAPTPDADGWREHTPGDPMPCPEDVLVEVKERGRSSTNTDRAHRMDWRHSGNYAILAWRPAA